MIPGGMGGMNPKQMKKMMAQMGIKSNDITAKRVVIEKDDGKIIITSPQITEIEMQGQKSYQIVGEISYEETVKDEDAEMVSEQTGTSKEDARKALEEAGGDIAEAIMKLKGEE